MTEKEYAYWLFQITNMSSKKANILYNYFGDCKSIYHATQKQLQQISGISEKDISYIINSHQEKELLCSWKKMEQKNIRFVFREEKEFPQKVSRIYEPPFALYYKGKLPENNEKTVAVVGARNASYEGKEIAYKMGRELAENGISVVSGLARGVDVSSQNGVLQIGGGKTYGVLGSGIDVCYPKNHIETYTMIQKNGGVISEYGPGVSPLAYHFPQRNRIISGLSDAILVIEAGKKSGSIITAELGLDQGKDIFVVPGSISNPCYEGSNSLIQNGAMLVTKTRDILDGLGLFFDEDVTAKKKKNEVKLETTEKIVYSYLSLKPIHLSEIGAITGLSITKTMEAAVSLELKGLVNDVGNHYYAIKL